MAETRERILDAAVGIVRTRGLARATTKEIARAAGLSEAALYRHFRNKEDIFIRVMRERLPGFIDAMKDLPARVGRKAVATTLEEIARAALAFYVEMIPIASSLFSEPEVLARFQGTLREEHAGPQVALVALAAHLQAEQRLGRIPAAFDSETAAALLLGACFQRAYLQRFLGKPTTNRDEKRFARNVVKSLLR